VRDEVEEFGGGFHDRVRGGCGGVKKNGDAAIGVEAKEPFFLLIVCGDVAIGTEDCELEKALGGDRWTTR
jgi:hypothetical protein